jgi:hypothetical protein
MPPKQRRRKLPATAPLPGLRFSASQPFHLRVSHCPGNLYFSEHNKLFYASHSRMHKGRITCALSRVWPGLQADVSESLRQAVSRHGWGNCCYHRSTRESVNIARARIAAGSEINRARIETRYGKLSQFQDDAMSELHVYGNWAVKGMMALVLRD